MDDGIGVTGLTIGGTALTAIGGLLGAWLRSRHNTRRIEPQPLEVRGVPTAVTVEDCREHRRSNTLAHENIFSRLSEHDKKIAALEEQGRNTTGWLKRIDGKLDELLVRREK